MIMLHLEDSGTYLFINQVGYDSKRRLHDESRLELIQIQFWMWGNGNPS
jgi:hypothetical protein